MKRMELVDFELAFKEAVPTHKKVGWVSVFDKTIHFFKSFIFKAKAFSFCLFYCTVKFIEPAEMNLSKFRAALRQAQGPLHSSNE
jgi:hypothetical protein